MSAAALASAPAPAGAFASTAWHASHMYGTTVYGKAGLFRARTSFITPDRRVVPGMDGLYQPMPLWAHPRAVDGGAPAPRAQAYGAPSAHGVLRTQRSMSRALHTRCRETLFLVPLTSIPIGLPRAPVAGPPSP